MRDVRVLSYECSECGEDVELVIESGDTLRDDLCYECVVDKRVDRAMELMRKIGVFE